MDKMVVIVFDTETKAYEASRALAELHREGNLTVYSGAVIAKDTAGRLSVRQETYPTPVGAALGTATGALIGVLAGPVGLALGAAFGALGGSMVDFASIGVGQDFLNEVSRQLSPGKAAIVAEIEEEWLTPLDTRMEALGGIVYRRPRVEVEDARMEREAAALQAEITQLQAEFHQAGAEAKAKLQAKLDSAKARLETDRDRVKSRIDEMNREAQEKIQSLQDQASKVSGEAKVRLQKQIDNLKADYQARSEKLRQAWQLTKQAFGA